MTVDTALWLIGLAGIIVACVAFAAAPVSRRRVERFADRQGLTVTAANGGQVLRYLVTTRRWRTAGFIGGYLLSVATQPQRAGEISIGTEWIIVFIGWLLGALIAEVRAEHLEHGRVRTASLQPRQPHRYVRRFAWSLVPASAVMAMVTAAASVAAGTVGWAAPDWTWAGIWLAVALVVAAVVRAMQYGVLRRPQPLASSEVIEADDAVRSRSLHVLSGAGAALVLLMVLNQIGSIHPVGIRDSIVISVRIFGAIGVALLGWLVATSMSPPPERAIGARRQIVGSE